MAKINYTVSKTGSTAVIDYAAAKEHLRLTNDVETALVQSYIDAAVVMAENYTGQLLNVYNVTAIAKTFIDNLVLEHGPVKANFKIEYYNSTNDLTELPAASYVVLNNSGSYTVAFNSPGTLPALYDRPDAVKITYEAGQTAAAVSADFPVFIKLCITFLYENRADSVDKLPRFMYSILRPYKLWD